MPSLRGVMASAFGGANLLSLISTGGRLTNGPATNLELVAVAEKPETLAHRLSIVA